MTISPQRAVPALMNTHPAHADSPRPGAARFYSIRALASMLAGLPLLALYVTSLIAVALVVWLVALFSFFFRNNQN